MPVNGISPLGKGDLRHRFGAQEAAAAAFQSGKSMLSGDAEASLDKVAREYIKSHGKDLHGQPLDQYFIHGLGHYIGLGVHDAGDYKVPLGPGWRSPLSLAFTFPEENIGVRIEDDYVVDADGKLVKLRAHRFRRKLKMSRRPWREVNRRYRATIARNYETYSLMYSSLVCASWRTSPSKITLPVAQNQKAHRHIAVLPTRQGSHVLVFVSNSCVAMVKASCRRCVTSRELVL